MAILLVQFFLLCLCGVVFSFPNCGIRRYNNGATSVFQQRSSRIEALWDNKGAGVIAEEECALSTEGTIPCGIDDIARKDEKVKPSVWNVFGDLAAKRGATNLGQGFPGGVILNSLPI